MSNQIDKLFKKKLEEHSIEPGPNVWAKVSAASSKKNKAVIWFRAAAALLLTASAFWLYNNNSDNGTGKIAEVATEKSKAEEQVVTQKESEEANHVEQNNRQASTPAIPKKQTLIAEKKSNKPRKENTEKQNQKIIDITEPLEAIAQMDVIPQDSPEESEMNTASASKPIVIVYELKSYAKKTESELEPEPLLQKKNGLKKVLDVANDLRTGESPLGGLRQAKEDLFALNFKKEDRKNNR